VLIPVSSRKLRFDGWVLDPESGDLERGGTRNRLQEQPVQVLRELIAHAGSVVPREQLIALLWPQGVVDFDTGLNTAIRKLRSALGDTSETPRYNQRQYFVRIRIASRHSSTVPTECAHIINASHCSADAQIPITPRQY
jgi:DNA-binding response OmpR family regulator